MAGLAKRDMELDAVDGVGCCDLALSIRQQPEAALLLDEALQLAAELGPMRANIRPELIEKAIARYYRTRPRRVESRGHRAAHRGD